MTQFLSYAIPGLPYGCVFALMAVGLVLTYQTSGVFNLAYGAQAYASALIFYVCVNAGWPSWAAFLTAVVVAAPLLGLAMDRFLYRFIRSAPVLVKLVSSARHVDRDPERAPADLRGPGKAGAAFVVAPSGIGLLPRRRRRHQRHGAVDGHRHLGRRAAGVAHVALHPDRAADAGHGREPRAWSSSPASTPSASASPSGSFPAFSRASPECFSPRCSRSCRRSTSPTCWSPRSPLRHSGASPASRSPSGAASASESSRSSSGDTSQVGACSPRGSGRPFLSPCSSSFCWCCRAFASGGSTMTPLPAAIRHLPRWRRPSGVTGSRSCCAAADGWCSPCSSSRVSPGCRATGPSPSPRDSPIRSSSCPSCC